jgi:uncharacterized flavoprotein (TIGR03862 family)
LVLALGGASWPKLGSDGSLLPWLTERGAAVAPLKPTNCGFDVGWSELFAQRFAGQPIKHVSLSFSQRDGSRWSRQGEFVVTATGIEGSLVYAASAELRAKIERDGAARIALDLAPAASVAKLARLLSVPRGSNSLANHWRKRIGLDGVKANLLREVAAKTVLQTAGPAQSAALIKHLPLLLRAPRPIEEAISTAGGVRFESLDNDLMISALPGVFCAGEMLDWEAPTGGFLLTGCMATGKAAAAGALKWLNGLDRTTAIRHRARHATPRDSEQ